MTTGAALLLVLAVVACSGVSAVTTTAGDAFPPPRPVVPAQFRGKAKVWLGADHSQPPVLLLYHHDDVGRRTREDYYHLVGTKHTRFYTSIKLFDSGQNFMIFHRQPRSPRACFITPLLAPLFHADALDTAVYVGPATVQWWSTHIDHDTDAGASAGTAASAAGATGTAPGTAPGTATNAKPAPSAAPSGAPRSLLSNETCAHWRLSYDGDRVELCVHPRTGAPMLLHHPYIRAHVLDWTVLSASAAAAVGESSAASGGAAAGSASAFSAGLFDPARASVARCSPFGASAKSDRR